MNGQATALWRSGPGASHGLGRAALAWATLRGWRRWLGLALAGALGALALPPVGLIPVLLLALPLLILSLSLAKSGRAAFAAGWWWGLGWYGAGFYWLAHAFLIEPDKFGWMIPFATLGLGGVVAVFLGFATFATHLTRLAGIPRILALSGFWTLSEWARSWVLTGFPWNPLGSVWDPLLPILQLGAWVGVYGLCLMTVLVFGLPTVLLEFSSRQSRIFSVCVSVGLVASGLIAGQARLSSHAPAHHADIRLRLVQASVPQLHKWRPELREAHFGTHLELSKAPGWEAITHVIWPETAAPFFLDLDRPHRALVASVAPYGGMVLAGAPRVSPEGIEPLRLWNSLIAIDGAAQVLGIYDKVHLVPFGEYVPFRQILPLDKITHGGIDYSPGPDHLPLSLPGLPPLAVIICYESVFPGEVVSRTHPRPAWMLTLTNDGWFGHSAGPYQHLAAGRMRAIEEGLPLVRAANSGISTIIDPLGRIGARLELGQAGVLDGALPLPLPAPPYARWGNVIPLSLSLGMIVLAVLAGRRRRNSYSAGATPARNPPD